VLAAWLAVQLPAALGPGPGGVYRVDFLTYWRAADALAAGGNPYGTPEASRAVWRRFHADESELLAGAARGQGTAVLQEQQARPASPGPYLYPPTLASLVAQLDLTGPAFSLLSLGAVAGFAVLWLSLAGLGGWWLLLLAGSWDLLASVVGGNVELLVLCLALVAARLLWAERARVSIWAAPPMALVLLVKPFYALLFLGLGALRLGAAPRGGRGRTLVALVAPGAAAALLVGAEVARWGPGLRAEALGYLGHALEYQWYALPLDEQTPMSAWNRTAMQALVSTGAPPGGAQAAAYGLWVALTGVTVGVVGVTRRRAERPVGHLPRPGAPPLPFALAFGVSFVLLYWARPVGWTFVYLEIVVAGAAWPWLRKGERAALLIAFLLLAASHWWALATTVAGQGMAFLTVQGAGVPWESWLVLPACWLVLLLALARSAS
jgi:hypothetical protein